MPDPIPTTLPSREELLRKALFVPCNSKEALHRWIKVYLGIDLPDVIVDPTSNSSPMDLIWEIYDAAINNRPGYSQVLAYAARDSFKTFSSAILEVLCITHLGRSVAHMAAIEPQAKKSQQYLKKHFARPFLRDYVTLKNERMVEVTRYHNSRTGENLTLKQYEEVQDPALQLEFQEIKNYVTVVICTIQGANSEHVPFMVVDEVDVVENPDAYQEAKMIPAPIDGKLPITLYTSTRKYSFGLVQTDLIDKADEKELVIRHWNLIDVTHRCPASRHLPDEPKVKVFVSEETLKTITEGDYGLLADAEKEKYKEDTAYAGCMKNCRLFAACRGRLAEKPPCPKCNEQGICPSMYKPVIHVQAQFKNVSLDKAKAQLMCWKPSLEGLIYPNFNRETHMLTPAQMAEKITGEPHRSDFSKADLIQLMQSRGMKAVSGMDHGFSHNFAVVTGFRDGPRFYIVDVISQAELELMQKIDLCKQRIHGWDPVVYPDTAYPSDNKTFKRHGFKMKEWNKGKDSVAGGISIVRTKIMPALGKPEDAELYLLQGDEGCELLATRLGQYHYTVDAAGRITDIPDEENDDECDACRYALMNEFAPKGKPQVSSADPIPQQSSPGSTQYTQENWAAKVIFEATGGVLPSEESAPEETPRRSGKFLWDL